MKLINAFLNDIGEGNDFMSSLKLFHFLRTVQEKCVIKVDRLEAVCFTTFFAVDLAW